LYYFLNFIYIASCWLSNVKSMLTCENNATLGVFQWATCHSTCHNCWQGRKEITVYGYCTNNSVCL